MLRKQDVLDAPETLIFVGASFFLWVLRTYIYIYIYFDSPMRKLVQASTLLRSLWSECVPR